MAEFKGIDLTGNVYGRLTVIKYFGYSITPKGKRRNKWECLCSCGNVAVVGGSDLRKGHTLSCGCYQKEQISNAIKTHGLSKTRLYRIWSGMKKRCENPNAERYPHYGGRGITVCKEWNTFESFRDWALNNGYNEKLSIDRKDLNKGYEPSNCKWSTDKEQANNTSRSHTVEFNGETHTISEWSEITGITRRTLNKRINNGWSPERALTEKPVIGKNQFSLRGGECG